MWKFFDSSGAEKLISVPRASLVTALPSNPSDGDEIIFTDSLTAPTYQWHLRYVAAKASNKWVFLGGSDMVASRLASDVQTANSTWEVLNSPSITVPVAGDYRLDYEAELASASSVYTFSAGVKQGASGGSPPANHNVSMADLAGSAGNFFIFGQIWAPTDSGVTAVAASTVLQMVLWQNGAVTTTWGNRRMRLRPLALGG